MELRRNTSQTAPTQNALISDLLKQSKERMEMTLPNRSEIENGSIDNVIDNPLTCEYFKTFITEEHSEENINVIK